VLFCLLDVVSIKKDAQPRKILQEKVKNFFKNSENGEILHKKSLRFVRRLTNDFLCFLGENSAISFYSMRNKAPKTLFYMRDVVFSILFSNTFCLARCEVGCGKARKVVLKYEKRCAKERKI